VKIAIVAGSLEPGKDGVGDYSRLLAAEATRLGAPCRLLALADRHARACVRERDDLLGDVLRLPFGMPWRARVQAAASFLGESTCDWLSVQFVPYSFDRRGLTGTAVRAVRELAAGLRLHVMLHEIWIDGSTSWKARLVSAAQRRAILKLCAHPGAVIHTSNGTYQRVLREHGVAANVLPLFGSIPVAGGDASAWLPPLLAGAGCDALTGARDRWWLFAIFGTLHPVWPPLPLLTDLQAAAAASGRRIAIVSVGRIGSGERLWNEMASAHGAVIPMVRLGEQSTQRISEVLQTVDYGIATSPLALVGKSATVAAMFDHGLPVVVNREDCRWPAGAAADPRETALVIRSGPGLGDRLRRATRLPAGWTLEPTAARWLADLNAAAVDDGL
jgi:hypothetical protein